jgi:hypothetical protein
MTDEPSLRPAHPEEIADALAHALRFDGRRAVRQGAELMARITAEHLVRHLDRAGFVIMRKPPALSHRTSSDTPRER